MSKQSFTTGQVLTAAQVNSLQANDFNQTVSVKTANYTLAAADKGTRIEFNTSGSVTCTVNSGLFDAGDTLVIQNRGAGTATITAGTATVNTSASLALAQYSAGTLYFVSDSAAIFFGDAAGISASIVDAKGDLIVGTADNTVGRLAVGTNGYTLVADSTETTGLKWQAAAAGGGVDLLSTTTLSSSSTTINIVTTYKNLIIVGDSIYGSAENTSGGISARFNSDSGNNYNNTLFRFITTAGGGTDGVISNFNITERLSSTNTIGRWSTFLLTIPNYTETSTVPFFIQSKGATNSGTATLIATGQYDGTAAISSITINAPSGETLYGTIKIYGAK